MTRNPFQDTDSLAAPALNSLLNAHAKEAFIGSISVDPGSGDFEVDIAGDQVVIGSTIADVVTDTLTHDAPDATDRVDLVTVDSAGASSITKGTPATEQDAAGNDLPVAPDIPDGEALAASVVVRSGASEILGSDIAEPSVLKEDVLDGPHGVVEATDFEEAWATVGHSDTYISDNSIELAGFFDISTASFSQSFDVSSEDSDPTGVAWNIDGSRMYTVGFGSDNVYEYRLTTPYDISTASFSQSFDVSSQDSTPQGMAWNDDGSKMYVVGSGSENVYEYDLTTLYDISTASFSQSFSISITDSTSTGVAWNDDGSKMYTTDIFNSEIHEYDVSTAYDISTASFSQSFDVSSQDSTPQGMAWNNDGSKLFFVGASTDNVYEYDVSTAYNISTASFSQSLDVSSEDSSPEGMAWNDEGSKMYMVGSNSDNINEYDLESTATSGTATVELPTPPGDADAYEWAYYQDTPDSETVTVDVQEDTGTWTDVATDIAADTAVSVAAASVSNPLRFNVTLSRSDTSNNPTFDYGALSWRGTESKEVNARTVEFDDANNGVETADTGSSYTIDLSTANQFKLTLTADVTFTFSETGAEGNSFVLTLQQDSTGGRSITWPSSVEWSFGSAPSLSTAANDKHVITFISNDGGTTWIGMTGAEEVA